MRREYQEFRGVMYKKKSKGIYEFIYEGVKGVIVPSTPLGLRKALEFISSSDPWELWHDRYIVHKDFYIEVLN